MNASRSDGSTTRVKSSASKMGAMTSMKAVYRSVLLGAWKTMCQLV